MSGGSVAAPAQPRDPLGYGLTIGSYLLFGISATLVTWADAPQSVLLVIRFALAAAVLLLVFARRRPLRGVLQAGRWQRLLLMGALDAFTMIAYFFAVRTIGVAVANDFCWRREPTSGEPQHALRATGVVTVKAPEATAK